ncbi:hypothetical protein [Ferrovibrio sp.]|uniref:hypothetical protein n=1 Tax=Ferrovibrio sp. TaxID=1917215 RepID=UPI000CC551B4|nr:hypothetical protein [Ferrovibrio sp.]PJI43271.1 MAG: hypothetical protein CTR53_03070 [Ferrovibrio sp.]
MLGAIGGFNPLAMLGGMAATKAIDAVSSIFAPEPPPEQTSELKPLVLSKDQQQLLDFAKIEDASKMRLAWFDEQPVAQNAADMDAQQRSQLEETLRKKTEDHVRAMTGKTSGGLVNLVA